MDRIWVEKHARLSVIHLGSAYGSCDLAASGNLEQALVTIADLAHRPHVLLHMGNTAYIGAEFLGMLVRVYRRIRERGGRWGLCGVGPGLQIEFQVTHLDKLWPIYATQEEAVKKMTKNRLVADS